MSFDFRGTYRHWRQYSRCSPLLAEPEEQCPQPYARGSRHDAGNENTVRPDLLRAVRVTVCAAASSNCDFSHNSRDSFPWLMDKTTQFQSFKTSCWFLLNGPLGVIFHAFGGGNAAGGLQCDVVGLCDGRKDEASDQGRSANARSCAQRVARPRISCGHCSDNTSHTVKLASSRQPGIRRKRGGMFDSATPSSLFSLTLFALVQSLKMFVFLRTIFQTTHPVRTMEPFE